MVHEKYGYCSNDKKSNEITALDVPSDIEDLQAYLKNLKVTTIAALEETTTSQWLYAGLKDYVELIFIGDPNRNKLLNEGPRTEKIGARKLVQLLKAGLMKEVYHGTDMFLYLRRVVSGYVDLVKAGVRLQNQRPALLLELHRAYQAREDKRRQKLLNKESQVLKTIKECLQGRGFGGHRRQQPNS